MLECADGSLYTGMTNDLEHRLTSHQAGKGAKYTRARLPVKLVYQEPANNRSAAARREYQIKQLTPAKKRALF
jgi:putative endonuclease